MAAKLGKEWSKEDSEKLIELYRDRPCLWKLNHEHYTNKNIKNRAYDDFVDAFREAFPQVNHSFFKTKIQNLRGVYRKELRKVEASERSGKGTDEQYTPALWYFNLLAFTRDQERVLPSVSNFEICQKSLDNQEEITEDVLAEDIGNYDSQEKESEQFFKEPTPKKRRGKDIEKDLSQFVKTCSALLSTPSATPDDCSALGNYVAAKLRKMEGSQQILAEALIQKVVTKAMKNQLTDNTKLLETPPSHVTRYSREGSPNSDMSTTSPLVPLYDTTTDLN